VPFSALSLGRGAHLSIDPPCLSSLLTARLPIRVIMGVPEEEEKGHCEQAGWKAVTAVWESREESKGTSRETCMRRRKEKEGAL